MRDLLKAAARILIERNAELFDEIWPAVLDEPWRVFRKVLRAFCHEIPDSLEHFVSDPIGAARIAPIWLGKAAFLVAAQKVGVEVAIGPIGLPEFKIEVKRHVIDA